MTLVAGAQAQLNVTAKTSFGANGWLAPAANSTVLDIGNNTRGMAYDAATNQLVVVNRTGGNNINLLNATTGVANGTMDGTFSGGTFTNNMVAAVNGKVYIANLSTSATANFKIYEYASATNGQTSTVIFDGLSGILRTGDTFDAMADGAGNTVFAASGSGSTGYAFLSNSGSGYTSTAVNPGAPVSGHRLGITFGSNPNEVYGTAGVFGGLHFSNGSSLTTIAGIGTASSRPIDFIQLGGRSLIATVDTVSNDVRIIDVTDPNAAFVMDLDLNTAGDQQTVNLVTAGNANANGVGQVKWGAVNGNVATLYVMSTNNGIQAFEVDAVPEPATMIVLAGAAAIAARRRRKNS